MEDYTLHVDSEPEFSTGRTHRERRQLVSNSDYSINSVELEWLLIAKALDRLAILIYLIASVIMMSVCF